MIADNAGMEGSIVVEKVKEKKGAFGFNARTDKYEDMIAAGVIDPTKVTRFALQNAASVASLMLTTQCMIADKPEEKARRHAGHASGAADTPAWGCNSVIETLIRFKEAPWLSGRGLFFALTA